MHNNAPSHISKVNSEFFECKRLTGDKIVEWPLFSSNLNPIENLWSIVKMKLSEGGKQ